MARDILGLPHDMRRAILLLMLGIFCTALFGTAISVRDPKRLGESSQVVQAPPVWERIQCALAESSCNRVSIAIQFTSQVLPHLPRMIVQNGMNSE
jgi:hypothetical protein